MNRRGWSPQEIATVSRLYPHMPTADVARAIGRSVRMVYQAAARFGLSKSEEYLASPSACRLRRGDSVGAATRFKPGQVPQNKGLRRPGYAPGRMRETQFKKGMRTGVAAKNWCPVGTIRTDAEGFLRIKVREGFSGETRFGFGNTDIWPLLNRHVWEQHHGPIPKSHSVVFKDRDRTNCAIENLELISRRELMARNTVHRLPKEIALAIQLNGALKRKIRSLTSEKQDDGSTQSPVRDARSA